MLKKECVEFQVDRIDDLAAAGPNQTTKDGSSCWIFLFSYFCLLFSFFLEFFLLFHWISLSFVLLHSFILIMFSIIVKVGVTNCKRMRWSKILFVKKSSQKDISQLRRELIFHKFCLNIFKRIYFLIEHLMTRTNVMLCEIWNHLHNLKNVKRDTRRQTWFWCFYC